eukprot:scaffold100260_cov44-Phaeocystis_antarctica.AAC.2
MRAPPLLRNGQPLYLPLGRGPAEKSRDEMMPRVPRLAAALRLYRGRGTRCARRRWRSGARLFSGIRGSRCDGSVGGGADNLSDNACKVVVREWWNFGGQHFLDSP